MKMFLISIALCALAALADCGWSAKKTDVHSRPIPKICPASYVEPSGETKYKYIRDGRSIPHPTESCARLYCLGGGNLVVKKSCSPLQGNHPNCIVKKGTPNARFPLCCDSVLCN